MKHIKIEFFHDTICSFCFPMSYRMRKIAEANPDVEIIHRSFALAKEPVDFISMFGTREAAKKDIMSHWQAADQNDELHRFQIEGMMEQDFLFPLSMPALYASKAASFLGGQSLYWDVFDALQSAFFEKNKNIEKEEVIFEELKKLNMDFGKWKDYFYSQEVKDAVEEDFRLVSQYGITAVPSFVVNEEYLLSGTQSYETFNNLFQKLREEP